MTSSSAPRILAMSLAAMVPLSAAMAALRPAKAPVEPVAATPTTVSMKQITVTIDPAADTKVNSDKIAAFQAATLGIFSCADVESVAQSVGATVTTADAIPISAMPVELQATVRTMKIGTATQMFGNRSEGKVRVLVLCARK